MFEHITEVIGFDLGHGETALARLNLGDPNNVSDPELIEIFANEKNIPTAIGYLPDGEVLIGEIALKKLGVDESFIAFKKRPNSHPQYQKIMNDFIGKIYQQKMDQGQINKDSTFFLVGCPSEWTQDASIVEAYQQIFINAGIKNVKVVAESRAAYIQVSEKKFFTLNEAAAEVIVIDLGSSTTDITIIDQNKNGIPTDIGRDLGASFIEKMILKEFLSNLKDENIQSNFQSSEHFRNQCEFSCRRAKEAFFANPGQYPNAEEPCIVLNKIGNILIEVPTDATMIKRILNDPCINIDGEITSWIQAFRNELTRLHNQLGHRRSLGQSKESLPGAILLTGGASRMNFVRELCQEVFPGIPIKNDDTPEFCIARGLARWGRIEIKTVQFSKDIDEFCSGVIMPRVSEQVDSLYDAISNVIAEKTISIFKHNFDLWKKRKHVTVDDMKSAINTDIDYILQEENLSKLFGDEILPILKNLADELRIEIKQLEHKYSIAIGNLGSSFDLSQNKISHVSLGRQTNIDAVDDMVENMSSIVGWVSGILATIIAVIIGPVIYSITAFLLAFIVAYLGLTVAAILLATPVGWIVLGAIGITVTLAGTSIKAVKDKVEEAVNENLPAWDLPVWVRDKIDSGSVYSKIDENREKIVSKIVTKLKSDNTLREELVKKLTNLFEVNLRDKADEMRILVS
ncbi:MAG: hypothetical protein WA902_06015 [Thermosynechococcaceae cyanobacterium]